MIPILLSTACYHRKYEKVINSVARAIKPSHDIEGIELSLLSKNECLEFEIDNDFLNYSKNHLTFIHAPAKNIIYSDNFESNIIIDKLKNVYDSLNAKNITFHLDNIESIDYLINEMKGYDISIENPDVKRAKKDYFETIENYLNNYDINLTLDLEHARNDLSKFLKPNLIKRIAEIHYSNYNPDFNHDCYSAVFKRFNDIINAIKIVNKPVVIEVDLRIHSQLLIEFVNESGFIVSKEISLLKNNIN